MAKQGHIRAPLPPRGPIGTLSVCMIVKNEEDNIARAIQSFLPFADEIIVNDTGSTDRTKEIVRSLPKTKLIESQWISDFSYSRNLSIDAATCSWCLWMDADDYVPPDHAQTFLKLKQAPLDRAFGFQVYNTLNGMPVGVRFMQIRMFPNHPKLRFQGKVHEQVAFDIEKMGLHIYNLETAIWHLGYETLEIRQKKAQRNLAIQLADPMQTATPAGLLQLGDSYGILGDNETALQYYLKAFEFPRCQELYSDIYRTVPDNIGRQYLHLKQYDKAEEWFLKSAELFPGRPDPVFYRADIMREQGRIAEAMELYRSVLSMEVQLTTTGTRHDIIRMHTYKYLCEQYDRDHNYTDMEKYARQFQQQYPETLESSYYLGLALLRLGQPAESAQILQTAYNKNPVFSKELLLLMAEAFGRTGNSEGMERIRADLRKMESSLPTANAAPLVSLCMIVKNEEANIGDCLASAQGLADEIIVVDTGSTDRTVEIAQAHGARIEHFTWIQDFAAARNHSIKNAQGKWILWLDADDRVPEKTVRELRQFLQTAPTDRFYALAVKNTTDNGRTGTNFDQVRVFPNSKGAQFKGRIHEQVFESLEAMGLQREALLLEVYHTGYTDPETIAKKQQRNLQIFQAEFRDESKMNPLDMFHFAAAHENTGNSAEALRWMRKSLALALQQGTYEPLQTMIPAKVATLLANQGKAAEALAEVEEGLRRFPRYEECLLLKAQLLLTLGKPFDAMRWFGYCTLFERHNTYLPLDFRSMRLQGCKALADYWHAQGEHEMALQFLKLAKNVADGEEPSLLLPAEIYFEHERYDFAVDNLEFARPLCNDSEEFCLLLGKSLALAGKLDEARRWVEWSVWRWNNNSELKELSEILNAQP